MKMKIRCGLLALLLLGSSVMANAGSGIKRSEWDYRPEVTVGNFAYWLPVMFGHNFLAMKVAQKYSDETAESLPWWFPAFGLRNSFLSDLSIGGVNYTDEEGNYFNWTNPEFSVGFGISYTSKQVPFGFRAKIAYDHQGFRAREKKGSDWTVFTKDMIIPEAALKILFGKYRTSGTMIVVSLGARYDYAIGANGLYNGKETVNNGWSGIAGFEYASPAQHASVGGNFVIPFYDYFNKSFSPNGGMTYPYEKAKAGGFVLMEVYIRYGF